MVLFRPVSFPGGPARGPGDQPAEAPPGAEVEHDLSRLQLRQRSGIPAAKRSSDRFGGQAASFRLTVEIARDGIAAAQRGAASAAGGLTLRYLVSRRAVLFFHCVLES